MSCQAASVAMYLPVMKLAGSGSPLPVRGGAFGCARAVGHRLRQGALRIGPYRADIC
jgi:hypothetical protein